jgi:hypothetical protein
VRVRDSDRDTVVRYRERQGDRTECRVKGTECSVILRKERRLLKSLLNIHDK